MSELFLKIVNMSISATWLVLAVLALRLIFKKAPKWVNVLLWGIVAVRLICPFSIESALSLIPSTETISSEIMTDWTPEISTGIETLDRVVNPVISTSFAPEPSASANPLQILIPVAANIWLLGVLVMVIYTAVSYWRLRRKVSTAVILRDNIFQCETIYSPFVLGIIKPRIYLPFSIDGQNLAHVVAHEQAHIRRKDHWWKPLGFLLLTIHWFNPLMWVAYVLLCRDIELACDEKVIKDLGNDQRADYTQALVACSVNRRMIAACPLAFGEVGVKERVKSVMNYKKPTFWIIIGAVIICVVVAVCFLTDPHEPVLNDVLYQKGYIVLSQNDREVTLTIPKGSLPNEIYTSEGYEFPEEQVVAYSTDTTTIWLRKVMLSNESPDQLYFAFDISYDIADKGTILSIYSRLPNDQYTFRGGLRSEDLQDNNTVYPGAVKTRGHGPDSQFWFYVSTDACKSAEGVLNFEVALNEIEYETDQRNRSFSMSGDNVSNLNPELIVDRILDIENWNSSNVYMNSNNFSLQVDSDFNWVDSQAIRYFFSDAKKTYSAQLRIFPDDDKYYLTESSEWNEQQSIFLLRHYLEAIKYLPQYAIREMAPADQYIIQQREEGRPSDYDRVITYSSEGVQPTDGWYIHLQIQPLHADGDAYSGTGEEVIDLFYGSSDGKYSDYAEMWFDFTAAPERMNWTEEMKCTLEEFPGITFKYTPYEIVATTSWEDDDTAERTVLISGMPIWNAYFSDMTGDGIPEICSEVSMGSGIIDEHVIIYDYANGVSYKLEDRGNYDYYLRMNDADGYLYVDKRIYNSDEVVSSGRLGFKDGCIQVEGVDTAPTNILHAKLLEIHDGYYIVEPVEGSWELSSAEKIEISMKNMSPSPEPQEGDILEIEYDGRIQETYPAKITEVYSIRVTNQKESIKIDESLIKRIQKELDLSGDCALNYAGEYEVESDVLLWFIVEGSYSDRYVAVRCEKTNSGKYRFEEILSTMTYTTDIVHALMGGEDIFLVNNRNVKVIVYQDEAGNIVKQIDLGENDYPYVFLLSQPVSPCTCTFVDSNGQEIR